MSRSPRTKNEKVAFCSGVVLWGVVLMRQFFGKGPPGHSPLHQWENQCMISSIACKFLQQQKLPGHSLTRCDTSKVSQIVLVNRMTKLIRKYKLPSLILKITCNILYFSSGFHVINGTTAMLF